MLIALCNGRPIPYRRKLIGLEALDGHPQVSIICPRLMFLDLSSVMVLCTRLPLQFPVVKEHFVCPKAIEHI